MGNLKKKDHITILKFYNINYKNLSTKQIKEQAEQLLVKKLCRCIKAVSKKTGKKLSYGICKNSVLKHKKLSISKFNCKTSKKGKYSGMKIHKQSKKKQTRRKKT